MLHFLLFCLIDVDGNSYKIFPDPLSVQSSPIKTCPASTVQTLTKCYFTF